MKKPYKNYFAWLFVLALLLASFWGIGWGFAKTRQSTTGNRNFTTSATPTVGRVAAMHVVKMRGVPAVNVKSTTISSSGTTDDDENGAVYDTLKAAAAHSPYAPVSHSGYQYNHRVGAALTNTPSVSTSFQGMSNSNAICPPVGCQVPDQALATSTNWVFQGVNTSFAVYSPSGVLQPGWPKTSQNFFGVPKPPNNCASFPYLIDPRAFYDPNDGRFWAATLQDEDVLGHQTSCPFQVRYWIAVSQTSDPNGLWNVYAFDMANGTTNGVDFTQVGFDSQAIYFSGNMFNQAGGTFQYAEIFAVSKALMESGASVTPHGFSNMQLNGVAVDTVHPVESETSNTNAPGAGLFINSLNFKFGGRLCSQGCQGVVVWALANPTSSTPTLTSVFVNTPTYSLAPYADQPGCTLCLNSDHTIILAPPVYSNGSISFALNTAVNNGTQVVPGILWGQVSPVLNAAGALTSASLAQSGYFNFQGDTAAYYGALMPDAAGDLYMVFEVSSSSIKPEVDYVARPVGYTPGLFPDAGYTLKAGGAPAVYRLWGDFDATSYDGFATDNVWMAGEYALSNGHWSTYIAVSNFTLPPPTPTGTPTPTPTPSPTPSPTPTPTPTSTPTPTPTPTSTPTPTPTPTSTSTPVSGAYSSAVLASQPVIYYRLDETSGTTAGDISGNGHNGTYTSGATLGQSGATTDGDAAIVCNGRALQYSTAAGVPTGAAPFSVEVWFKTTATPSAPYGSTLVAWGSETGNKMFALKIYSSTKMKLTNWSNVYYYNVPTGANTLDGNWHHVVATFDGTNATVYYDGQSLGTQAFSLSTTLNTAGLVIGSQTGNNDYPYVGSIDEVAIYNTVLSASQVLNHYTSR